MRLEALQWYNGGVRVHHGLRPGHASRSQLTNQGQKGCHRAVNTAQTVHHIGYITSSTKTKWLV